MRHHTLISFAAWMTITATSLVAGAKPLPVVADPAAQAASTRTLKELGGQPLAGMPAAHQLGKTTFGEPFVVKMVQLDDLQRYQPGVSDAAALLRDAQSVLYPIRVAGKLHGEMVVGKVGGSWSARGFAGAGRLKVLEEARGRLAGAAALPAGTTMLVQVPALNLEFIGHTDENGLQLTPITSRPEAGLTAGQTLPAARVFELLVPLAQQHQGLPT